MIILTVSAQHSCEVIPLLTSLTWQFTLSNSTLVFAGLMQIQSNSAYVTCLVSIRAHKLPQYTQTVYSQGGYMELCVF